MSAWAPAGLGEVRPGDDLPALLVALLRADAARDPARAPADGDVLVLTSKVVSKAEGRVVAADDREDAITAETVRVVATRAFPGGVTRIVENRLGLVMAAAGVDASNTPGGTVLLLPEDPDASARAVRRAVADAFGARVGVLVSDTAGRPWREGVTDLTIGAAGVRVLDDLRGSADTFGRPLTMTVAAVADELAAAAELVKGKATGRPLAVVRGAGHLVVEEDGPGARVLTRTGPTDMFALGTAEAYAAGWADGCAGRRAGVPGAAPGPVPR
ncbi:coenzyme F420-0:L-glutamate ligase [Cellulomonas endophytica]|uniref:coenzyme F420-0:L-glutamate ligase n=1 Tax=Cellulomonas endophytica TaxID=2494735 RepID=UPI001011032A|nr:coenzyme F420-0:L-glutamate ligase [Cellulomonas endophytica]